jgi:hypothetical protein
MSRTAVYVHEGLAPPKDVPLEFVHGEPGKMERGVPTEEPRFDPRIHLQIEPPKFVRNMDFEDVPFPYEGGEKDCFAYTPDPFRLLSDEGLGVLWGGIIDRQKPQYLKQNERNNCVRGLGYLSRFVRDFTYAPAVINILSELSRQPLWPHDGVMSHAHTNVGMVGSGKAVDQWHVDSVDYVCIVIVSDMTNMDIRGANNLSRGIPTLRCPTCMSHPEV